MEQLRPIDVFMREAEMRLPGFLYSFNIADLKRRNGHLGYWTGDSDIAELSQALEALASDSVIVRRVAGQRWLLFSAQDEQARIETLIARYRRLQSFIAGWQIDANRGGIHKSDSLGVPTNIARALRCLVEHVSTAEELHTAIAQINANDFNLPVDCIVPLEALPQLERHPYCCVGEYPDEDPACPFCSSRSFEWEDGDGNVYSGSGSCKGCGAEIAISTL